MKKTDSIFVKSKLKKMIKDSGASSIRGDAFASLERDLTNFTKCQISKAEGFAKHRKSKQINKKDIEMAKDHSCKI